VRGASTARRGSAGLASLVASLALLVVACATSTGGLGGPEASGGAVGGGSGAPALGPSDGPVAPSRSPRDASSSGAPPGAGTPTVPETSIDTVDKRLAVDLAGDTIYLRNGGQILLGDGLAVEIYLDPYPPAVLRSTMDVYLTKDGRGVADGGVEVVFDMLAMGHGSVSGEGQNIGGGHYLLPLDYTMFGPWEQLVTIRIGLQRIHLSIIVVAYP